MFWRPLPKFFPSLALFQRSPCDPSCSTHEPIYPVMDLGSGSRCSVSCPGSYTFVNASRHDLFCLLCLISLSHVLPFWCVTVLAGDNLQLTQHFFSRRSIKCQLFKNCPLCTFYLSLKTKSCCITRAAYSCGWDCIPLMSFSFETYLLYGHLPSCHFKIPGPESWPLPSLISPILTTSYI